MHGTTCPRELSGCSLCRSGGSGGKQPLGNRKRHKLSRACGRGRLDEVEGLHVSLAGAQGKLDRLAAEAAHRSSAVSLGIPAFVDIANCATATSTDLNHRPCRPAACGTSAHRRPHPGRLLHRPQYGGHPRLQRQRRYRGRGARHRAACLPVLAGHRLRRPPRELAAHRGDSRTAHREGTGDLLPYLSSGMLPRMRGCPDAVRNGVRSAHVVVLRAVLAEHPPPARPFCPTCHEPRPAGRRTVEALPSPPAFTAPAEDGCIVAAVDCFACVVHRVSSPAESGSR